MEKNIDRTNRQSGSSLPPQESEVRSDGWLKWLRSNMRMRKDAPITRPVEQGIDPGKESTGEKKNPFGID